MILKNGTKLVRIFQLGNVTMRGKCKRYKEKKSGGEGK